MTPTAAPKPVRRAPRPARRTAPHHFTAACPVCWQNLLKITATLAPWTIMGVTAPDLLGR